MGFLAEKVESSGVKKSIDGTFTIFRDFLCILSCIHGCNMWRVCRGSSARMLYASLELLEGAKKGLLGSKNWFCFVSDFEVAHIETSKAPTYRPVFARFSAPTCFSEKKFIVNLSTFCSLAKNLRWIFWQKIKFSGATRPISILLSDSSSRWLCMKRPSFCSLQTLWKNIITVMNCSSLVPIRKIPVTK